MFCIVGLGNPGLQYQETRHNAGFLTVDNLAEHCKVRLDKKGFQSIYGKIKVAGEDVFLIKPQTFMNLSGLAVAAIISYFKIPHNNTLIIYDDLDLPLGKLRFRLSGSTGGHKGLTSIIKETGNSNIPRLRIGIGRPQSDERVEDFVLTSFKGEEKKLFMKTIARAAEAANRFVTDGPEYVMNNYN